jgi:hypothetical protein
MLIPGRLVKNLQLRLGSSVAWITEAPATGA